jgi:hypothetical protein
MEVQLHMTELSRPFTRGISSVGAATTPKGEGWKKLRRKGRMAADGADAPGTPRSPTVYDWCVPHLAPKTVTAPSQKMLSSHTWHVWLRCINH